MGGGKTVTPSYCLNFMISIKLGNKLIGSHTDTPIHTRMKASIKIIVLLNFCYILSLWGEATLIFGMGKTHCNVAGGKYIHCGKSLV